MMRPLVIFLSLNCLVVSAAAQAVEKGGKPAATAKKPTPQEPARSKSRPAAQKSAPNPAAKNAGGKTDSRAQAPSNSPISPPSVTLEVPTEELLAAGETAGAGQKMLARVEQSRLKDEAAPEVKVGVLPEVMTSEAPSPPPEKVEGGADLEWLQGLKLPDFPIRWDDRVIKNLEYFRDNPNGRNQVRYWFRRANRYSDMIREKLRDASLPEDLLYVAMVESGFEPTAKSEVGALGMWQFVRETADEYGLERSKWYDQRMNPERSTDAAVRFLTDLQKRFNSWELTLAAFNMGYGATIRTISKYNTNDFWLLSQLEAGLPYETGAYVAKVMACAVVGRNPERFGLGDLKPDAKISVGWVNIPGGVWLSRLARAADMTTEELAALNPELKKGRVPPDARWWPLRVPAERRAQFLQKWEKVRPSTPTHRNHILKFGERLYDVAQMYGTTTERLRSLNDLDPEENVKPGIQLLVPDVDPVTPNKSSPVVATVPNRAFAYTDRNRIFYRAAEQDKLEEIARFFRVTNDEIRQWNNVTSGASLLHGMILQLFVPRNVDLTQAVILTPDEVTCLTVGSDEFFTFHEAQRDRVRVRYKVLPGDTLKKLADRFDLSPGSIGRINRINPRAPLKVDQEIIVYVPKDQAAKLEKIAGEPLSPETDDQETEEGSFAELKGSPAEIEDKKAEPPASPASEEASRADKPVARAAEGGGPKAGQPAAPAAPTADSVPKPENKP